MKNVAILVADKLHINSSKLTSTKIIQLEFVSNKERREKEVTVNSKTIRISS